MPVKPRYQSRPSSSTGRQACAAIATRIASVTWSPCAPVNCFSARNSSASSRSLSFLGMNVRRSVAAAQRASSMRCFSSTRRLRQFASQPMPVKYSMVSVVQLHPQSGAAALEPLAEGLALPERALLGRALELAEPLYAGQVLSTGEPCWTHALGLAASLAAIGVDAPGRAAGVLFAAPKYLDGTDKLEERFGTEIANLAGGVEKLYQLRVATRDTPTEQNEVLRKMVLGMVEDVRVVLIRLASRTQTLRFFSKHDSAERSAYARETLDIYAPLANRLGV